LVPYRGKGTLKKLRKLGMVEKFPKFSKFLDKRQERVDESFKKADVFIFFFGLKKGAKLKAKQLIVFWM
jgi:hypothetical protein